MSKEEKEKDLFRYYKNNLVQSTEYLERVAESLNSSLNVLEDMNNLLKKCSTAILNMSLTLQVEERLRQINNNV